MHMHTHSHKQPHAAHDAGPYMWPQQPAAVRATRLGLRDRGADSVEPTVARRKCRPTKDWQRELDAQAAEKRRKLKEQDAELEDDRFPGLEDSAA